MEQEIRVFRKPYINDPDRWWVFKNNGDPSYYITLDAAPLRDCELCGKRGAPKKVCYRNDCYMRVAVEPMSLTPLLCTGCWNKYRVVCRRLREVEETARFINRMKREVGQHGKVNSVLR